MSGEEQQEQPLVSPYLVKKVHEILYLDDSSDDDLIESYIKAAQSFVQNAVGEDVNGFYDNKQVSSLVELAVVSLAATYYQNRLALSDIQTYPIDLTVNSIIGQLRGIRNKFEEDEQSESTDKPVQSSN